MSDKEKSSYYGNKKYRHLDQSESDALKELLPPSWPDRIILQVEKAIKKNKDSYPRVPSKTHLYALVNGMVKDFTFMPLIMDLALEKKKINEGIKQLANG